MPHFVALPEKKFPQTPDPNFRSLTLHDKNGTAALGVWAASAGWSVRAKSNVRFLAERYKQNDLVSYFMLRGLLGGDEIAAFDPSGNQQTAWLPITKSAGDRGGAVIRQSTNFPNVKMDARGSNQGLAPMVEEDWLSWTERCLGKFKENPVGRKVMGFVTTPVTIMPFLKGDKNADARVGIIRFTPSLFGSDFRPGARPNEILFHEFCHLADGLLSTYTDNTAIPFQYDRFDFFSVTATNVYASHVKRPRRHDHNGFAPLSTSFDPAVFLTAVKGNFDKLKAAKPALYAAVGSTGGPWNPFAPSVVPIPVGP
jgi:hypothetical protein